MPGDSLPATYSQEAGAGWDGSSSWLSSTQAKAVWKTPAPPALWVFPLITCKGRTVTGQEKGGTDQVSSVTRWISS